MMRPMFDEISDPVRVTALEKAIGALNENRFPWNDRYVATAEPGHKVEVTMAGIAGEQFMARTATAILVGQTSDLPEPRPERGETFTFEPASWGRKRQCPAAPLNRRSLSRFLSFSLLSCSGSSPAVPGPIVHEIRAPWAGGTRLAV
jgi:hypothetical protein